jgi:hypothetical protein
MRLEEQLNNGALIPIDTLWLWLPGWSDLSGEVVGGGLQIKGSLQQLRLIDPLVGSQELLEQYRDHPHRYPGIRASHGPSSISLRLHGATTTVQYRFRRRNHEDAVMISVDGEVQRHPHKPEFSLAGETPPRLSGSAGYRIVRPRKFPVLRYTGKLENDLHQVGTIQKDIAERITASNNVDTTVGEPHDCR